MNQDPLAEIDIVEVARIAASISIPGLSDFARIREAYRLLKRASDVRSEASRAGLPLWEVITEEERRLNAKPVFIAPQLSLAVVLKKLMGQVNKREIRINRFMEFLVSHTGSREGVEALLAKYESEGVPREEFDKYSFSFRAWWTRHKASLKSKAGKAKKVDAAETPPPDVSLKPKADKPAKGKQGRVIRKNDKRKGSRAGSFLKALKKNS